MAIHSNPGALGKRDPLGDSFDRLFVEMAHD